MSVTRGLTQAQRQNCLNVLEGIVKNGPAYEKSTEYLDGDELFFASVNAKLVVNAGSLLPLSFRTESESD